MGTSVTETTLDTTSRVVLAFAGLAAVSAFASTYLGGAMLAAGPFDVMPLPGLYFGIALGLAAGLWCGRGFRGGATIFLAALVAWLLAFEAAMRVSQYLGRSGLGEIAGLDIQNAAAGLAAGALGAAVTFAGARFAGPEMWSLGRLGKVTVAGALLGILLDPAIEGDGSLLLLLFLPWQVAVAALVGRYMARPLAPGI